MPVIEHPNEATAGVRPGTFVIIKIDPVASVAALEDEQATREAAALNPPKVLALYDTSINPEYSALADGLQINAAFRLAGFGLPPAPYSAAVIPVYPTPATENGRAPLCPTPPLSWDDCYVYTQERVTGTVLRIYDDAQSRSMTTIPEFRAVKMAILSDNRYYRKLLQDQAAAAAAQEPVRVAPIRDSTPQTVNHPVNAPAPAPTNTVLTTDDPTVPKNDAEAFLNLYQTDDTPRMRVQFELWYDMSPALRSELGVAKDIRDMIDSLKRIEHDWAQRTIAAMLADQPETNAWLVGVTNDGEMEPPQDMDVDTEVDPEDDALVRPEDAIEHRFERDADSSIEDVGVHAHSVSRTQDETREASGAAAVSIAGTLPPAAPHEALRDSQSVAERSRAANAAKPKAPVASEPIPHPQQKSSSPSSTMPRKPRGAAVLAKLRAFPRSLVARLWGKVTGPPECLAMVVLENPTETENPIDDGTIVVLRVDPVASVSQIDDEQVRREVAVLKPCKALAFYTSGFGFDVSDRNGDLKVKGLFSLVGRGLPAAPLSCAAIPIAPSPSHPETGRHPVPTSPPFPLPGCYIHTMRQLNAAVRRIHKNAATGYALSAEDFRAARIALFADAHSFDPRGNKVTSEDADSDSHSSNENDDMDDPGPGNAVETADWKDIAPGLSQKDTSPRMTVHVELWLSLTESDELGTPEDVQATVTRLREIEKAWAKRQVVEILANRPATTAWLEGVTPHAEPERPADASAGSTREDDDLVLPEDAIEHRIERGDVPAEGAAATSTVSHGSSSRSPSQSHAAGHLPDAVTPELGASPVSHSRGKEHSAETKKARLSVAGRIRARVVKFVKRFQVKLGAKSA